MSNGKRSKIILEGLSTQYYRATFKSMGYTTDDLTRPIIGIANSWNEGVPGHFNLRQVAQRVRDGIYRAGGTPVEFGTIACCDGMAQGHKGMHYILPSREIICDSIETFAEAHRLDAIVLLGSCDKIVPGMLMAAARLNIPCILLPGGPMEGGIVFDGRESDQTSSAEAYGMLTAKKITEKEYTTLETLSCPTCGSCSYLGTANTMCCISEALGMTLPFGGTIPAYSAARLAIAEETGKKIVELVEKNITSRDIITEGAIRNAIKLCLAISGSTNAVMHLTAIAHEAELDMDVLSEFDKLSRVTPHIAKINPSSKYNLVDFHKAGGVYKVMKELLPVLDENVMTVSAETMEENIKRAISLYPENKEVIRTFEEPFGYQGGVAVLKGNLAPNTGITKPGAFDKSLYHFVGEAIVFDSEEEAEEAILEGKVRDGHVVVIRYEGPKGGPGMREMFKAMKYLYGRGLGKTTALITDGRFSGTNNGCFVGHISPEAAEGGPIAIVENGDKIEIDVDNRSLKLLVSDEEITARLKNWKRPKPKFTKGYLALYSKLAASGAEGAIMKYDNVDKK
ncbi:dihydroxy-acid dehydratase [Fusobacterium varium]|uniref:dihydroxy-acid dehydratase n=1 Tax=Fusobacterium varium TaxID=856 RepID=UPI001F2F8384|nr:dihydroxy-acid dehydratase [Fusobacterium varium]MCF2672207.1 dihydroxy-acid dehydratase [Fusobacterium varium]